MSDQDLTAIQDHMDDEARESDKFDKAVYQVLTDPNELVEFLQDLDGPDHFTIHLAGMFKAWLDDHYDYADNADFVCDSALKHPIVKKLAQAIVDGGKP